MHKTIVIENIYYMLSYAYQELRQDGFREINPECFENVKDLFAAILAKAMTMQLKRGLSREYIEANDNLSILKGKIDIKETFQLAKRRDRRIACVFDELSENHYMNRIIKTTILYLIRDEPDPDGKGGVRHENKDALKKVLLFLSGIETLKVSAIDWRHFRYNRNNATYQMLMHVCYLVLHDLLLTTKEGTQKLASFFDEQKLHALFERFVRTYYSQHYQDLEVGAKQIKWDADGTTAFLPTMQSDIMLEYPKYGRDTRKLIIDTKFYGKIIVQSQYGADKIRSNHLYQIYAYVTNEARNRSGAVDGMLLYAKTDEAIIPYATYILGGNKISVRVLDLNTKFDDIKKQLDSFVQEDWNLAY